MAKSKDVYSQLGYLNIVESAANTLTFGGLSVFSNVLGQKGMLINRVEYLPTAASVGLVIADGDELNFGLSGTDNFTATPELDDPQTYDRNYFRLEASGVPASAIMYYMPMVKSFSDLPGGGLLIPADRLYGWVEGGNLASNVTMRIRFWYQIFEMSAPEYLELAQAMRVLR